MDNSFDADVTIDFSPNTSYTDSQVTGKFQTKKSVFSNSLIFDKMMIY
jgi:hypothetical protein